MGLCDAKRPQVVVFQVAAISSLTPALRTDPGLAQQVGEATCLSGDQALWWPSALAALAKDPSFDPSTQMVVQTVYNASKRRI